MSMILKNKIKAVENRRFIFLTECFSDELSNGGKSSLKDSNILEKKKKTLHTDYSCNYKTVFTKKFIDCYIEELNITDDLCKKILKKLRFKVIDDEKQGDKKIDIRYHGDYLESLNKKEWDCIEYLFSEFKKVKKLFLNEKERRKITKFKKELCFLTDCYKNPDTIKIICEKCGILLDAETEFCPECKAEIKE